MNKNNKAIMLAVIGAFVLIAPTIAMRLLSEDAFLSLHMGFVIPCIFIGFAGSIPGIALNHLIKLMFDYGDGVETVIVILVSFLCWSVAFYFVFSRLFLKKGA